jgi:arylsulfatase A-like enzyme/Tfp pilus assembly protein PilF
MHSSRGAPDKQKGLRRAELFFLVLAVVLVLAGITSILLRWILDDPRHAGITREVLPELEGVNRIHASAGALRGFNLLLITTDTTRADHIGAYGNQSIQTPIIDGLARDGILGANTVTPSPSTVPAHSSLLTGLYPIHHGARANGTFRLEDDITTLAEHLRASGYRTGAVISAFVLDSRFGLDQGFEDYHDDLTRGVQRSPHMFRERPAELANEAALAWLDENGDERFFLWVHYFDPHASYLPPEPFRTRYAEDLYDGEIAYVDAQIGALLSRLEESGVRDRTLVVYTSDHGEGLGEHGEQTHSLLTYDATLRVPLILSAPSALPRGKVLGTQTSLVDVVPTVLALLGEEIPEGLDGRSLLQPPGPEPRPVYFETIATMTLHGWAPLMGVRRADYKYILAPKAELYDLRNDPRELQNLHDRETDWVSALRDTLVEIIGGDPLVAASVEANLALDDEAQRRLESLGYIDATPGTTAVPNQFELDPKEMIHHWENLQRAINLRIQGNLKAALPILEDAVAEVEADIFARGLLAGTYQVRGEHERALAIYQRSAEIEPRDEGIHLGIASVHFARGEALQAEAAIRKALEIAPESAPAHIQLGRLALMQRDEAKALDLFQKAIAMSPGASGAPAYTETGRLHLRAHRLGQARTAFKKAIAIDAFNGAAHDGLANLLIAEGKRKEAARELAIALRFNPVQPRALATLASLLSADGEHQRALSLCQRALELSPKSPWAHTTIGLVHRRLNHLELAEEHYRKAIAYAPHMDEPHINLAQLHERKGNHQDAVKEFQAALVVNRHSRIALANLGAHHYNQGRIDTALRFYRRALRVDPDYALVHKNIGSIYQLKDQPRLAVEHFRRALELDPNQPDVKKLRLALTQVETLLMGQETHSALPEDSAEHLPESRHAEDRLD